MSFEFDKDRVTYYFIDNYTCWYCGKNTASANHHIYPKSDVANCSKSIFNNAPICNYPCHLNNHGEITTEPWQKKFLQKTAKYLFARKIRLNDDDKEFLYKHKDMYLN